MQGLRTQLITLRWVKSCAVLCVTFMAMGCATPDDVPFQYSEQIMVPESDDAVMLVSDECEYASEVVSGRVVDEGGRPIFESPVVICPARADGSKVCVGPVLTDHRGHWRLTIPQAYQCATTVSYRISPPLSSDGPSVSCLFRPEGDAVVDVSETVLPTFDAATEPLIEAPVTVGVSINVDENHSNIARDAIQTSIQLATKISTHCKHESELFRFGIWPDGPAQGVYLTEVFLPEISDGQQVTLGILGGLYTPVNDEILEEGQLFHVGRAVVRNQRAVFDLELPALGWFVVQVE